MVNNESNVIVNLSKNTQTLPDKCFDAHKY